MGRKDIDVNAVDDQGKKPIDYAQNWDLKKLLKQ